VPKITSIFTDYYSKKAQSQLSSCPADFRSQCLYWLDARKSRTSNEKVWWWFL